MPVSFLEEFGVDPDNVPGEDELIDSPYEAWTAVVRGLSAIYNQDVDSSGMDLDSLEETARLSWIEMLETSDPDYIEQVQGRIVEEALQALVYLTMYEVVNHSEEDDNE